MSEQGVNQAKALSEVAQGLISDANEMLERSLELSMIADTGAGGDFFIMGLTVFVLACFVGYYVVWNVTPALHSPLMAVTNAISSVIIVGALIAAGPLEGDVFSKAFGFIAVVLASINIFGGFMVSRRMLQMFQKKKK